MPTNIEQFNKTLTEFGKSIPLELFPNFHRKIVLQFLVGVVVRTPVDTGRARGNWNVNIGSPSSRLKSERGFTSADEVGRIVEQAEKDLKELAPFEVVYVTNNVIYIKFLDRGSSKQAPIGMVAITLAEIESQLLGVT